MKNKKNQERTNNFPSGKALSSPHGGWIISERQFKELFALFADLFVVNKAEISSVYSLINVLKSGATEWEYMVTLIDDDKEKAVLLSFTCKGVSYCLTVSGSHSDFCAQGSVTTTPPSLPENVRTEINRFMLASRPRGTVAVPYISDKNLCLPVDYYENAGVGNTGAVFFDFIKTLIHITTESDDE